MRKALLISGITLCAALWFGPLPWLAQSSFAAHMTMHMGIVAVAAALIAAGLAGTRWDPVSCAPALLSPIPASILELIVVWGWHAPTLHQFARGSLPGLVLEQCSFLACGLILWLSAFGGERPRSRGRAAAGIIGLLLTSMHMTLLGALLALTPRVLHGHASAALQLTPLQDQHVGGAIMLLVGGVAYLAGGLYLTFEVLREHRPGEEGVHA